MRRAGHICKTGDTTGEDCATFRISILQLWAYADRELVPPRTSVCGDQ